MDLTKARSCVIYNYFDPRKLKEVNKVLGIVDTVPVILIQALPG